MTPALELSVSLRAPDGRVRARVRLCWADTPSVAAVLDALLGWARQGRRLGLSLVVESAPAGFSELLALAGLDGPDGPVTSG